VKLFTNVKFDNGENEPQPFRYTYIFQPALPDFTFTATR